MSDESGKYKSLLSFLMKIPLKHWVTAYIEAPNFGHLTNNLVEGHNKVILPARAASGVLTTIDWLRHRDGKFMESTRAKIPGTAGPNDLCTKVTAKLGLITKAAAESYVVVGQGARADRTLPLPAPGSSLPPQEIGRCFLRPPFPQDIGMEAVLLHPNLATVASSTHDGLMPLSPRTR
eukprot:TRINITY_DN264_c3_g1_i3.p1 TRINITY_DN264_c3_g1~~TRINITY_DN264_c3_g1_i3.p1  ORF type:complete len:191 (+),score=27.34 TRINITY_DN264_c3_g1_i3:42-575(+)